MSDVWRIEDAKCPKCEYNAFLEKVKYYICARCRTIVKHKSSLTNKDNRYKSWRGIRERCENPKCPDYKYYGAVGIACDPRWESFEQFCQDMGPKPTDKHTLDRINNDKGYFKDNCRWATRGEQSRNRRFAKECLKGHSWTNENTLWVNNGSGTKVRRCKICLEAYEEKRRYGKEKGGANE